MEDPGALLEAILAWARADDRIEVVVQTGSRARGTRVDEYSDLDIELIGPGWRELAAERGWPSRFGPVMVSIASSSAEAGGTPDAWTSRLVAYRGGRKVDFILAGLSRLRARTERLGEVYERGYLVHLDKSGATASLPAPTGAAPEPPWPTAAEFDHALDEFWFEASQVPVYLARGDLWVVKFRDTTMKKYLLRMLEWYAATEHAEDIWHIGHHMHEWLPGHLWQGVQDSYARFDATDSWRALHATIAVFRDASATVARRCGFPPRTELATWVTAHIDRVRTQTAG